ncbi:MAG: cytochrome d ubiquinol oxidase subunit II [Tatlockia sp.]|nr:cytochrome d ubiquinol oxidase subunit II [Tatlockia sp.]
MIIDFVPLWTLIIGAAIFFYVLLDGFDLGVGILYGLAPDRASRSLIMDSIAPIWDGNETWLVLGSVGLMAAFPLAFAIMIPAIYFPVLMMLLALIFRGVAFEFHYRDVAHVTFWDRAFSIGSTVAAFAQGIILGAYIQGFAVEGRNFVGSSLDCFTPFTLFTGIALIFGYGLLGANWLILKTEGELQHNSRRQARWCFIALLLAIIIVSIWTPLIDHEIARRWFSWPNIAYLAPIPIMTILIALFEWRSLNNNSEIAPFIGAIGLFLISYLGIAISFFPMLIPHHFTLWQAASDPDTQVFLAIGTMFLIPLILLYTAWSYWVFRGKVKHDLGYH